MKTQRSRPIDIPALTRPALVIDSWGRRKVGLPPADRLKRLVPTWGTAGSCWEWTGTVNPKGYGLLSVAGRYLMTHRVSYALHCGVDPGQLRVLHRCDNPPCVNPAHLFLGTPKDNTQDMLSKGRGVAPVNERNGRTTISTQQVEEIRSRASAGESYKAIARDIGAHPASISRIARRKRRVS